MNLFASVQRSSCVFDHLVQSGWCESLGVHCGVCDLNNLTGKGQSLSFCPFVLLWCDRKTGLPQDFITADV